MRRIVNGVAQMWQPCEFVSSTAVSGTIADLLYTIPVGGRVEIRVDSALGSSGTPIPVHYMVAMTPFRSGRADSVRKPAITSPINGTSGVTNDTPVISGDAYYSLYGVPQGGIEVHIATDPLFNDVVCAETVDGVRTSITVPAGKLTINTAYFVRLRYRDSEGVYSAWSDVVGFSTGAVFQYLATPAILSPAQGAAKVALCPSIQTGAFASVGVADTHIATQWQIAADIAFAQIVYASGDSLDLLEHRVPAASALNRLTTYYVRVRHKGAILGYSGWSSAKLFTTINSADAPVITSPANGADGIALPLSVTTGAFSFPGGGEAHVATQWQVATTETFDAIVHDSGDSNALTNYSVSGLSPFTRYFIRARHKGASTGYSPWSSIVCITTEVAAGAMLFSTVGTHDFVVPDGVYEVHVLCIGGGGGGGGGGQNMPSSGGKGGTSSFGTSLLAYGGNGATASTSAASIGGGGLGGDGGDGGKGGAAGFDVLGSSVAVSGSAGGSSGGWDRAGNDGWVGYSSQARMTAAPVTTYGSSFGGGGPGNNADGTWCGGGGAGGGLRFRNAMPVLPGQRIPVVVGLGGVPGGPMDGGPGASSGFAGTSGCVEVRWGSSNKYPR